jgi:hypothetical protein
MGHGWGVLEAQCSPNHPGFEGFPIFYTFRVVLVPTRGKRESSQFIANLPKKTKVRLIFRIDIPLKPTQMFNLVPNALWRSNFGIMVHSIVTVRFQKRIKRGGGGG